MKKANLTKTEREKVFARGIERIGTISAEVFLCGSCRAVAIPAGVGLCPRCSDMFDRKEAEAINDLGLFWRFCVVVAFGIFVISIFMLATGANGGSNAANRNTTRTTVR